MHVTHGDKPGFGKALRPKGCQVVPVQPGKRSVEADVPMNLLMAQAGSDAGGTPPGDAIDIPVTRYWDRVDVKSGPVSRL